MKQILVLNQKQLSYLKEIINRNEFKINFKEVNAIYHKAFDCRFEDFFTLWSFITNQNDKDSFTFLKADNEEGYIIMIDNLLFIRNTVEQIQKIDETTLLSQLKEINHQKYTHGYEKQLKHMLTVFEEALKVAVNHHLVIVIYIFQSGFIQERKVHKINMDDNDYKFLLSQNHEKLTKKEISLLKSWFRIK